jgi:uncharacterized protein YciI
MTPRPTAATLFSTAALVLAAGGFTAPRPLVAAPAPAAAPAAKSVPLFAVTYTTGPKWDAAKPPQDQTFFKEHSAHLARLRTENVSVLGGRYGDKGLLLLRARDLAAARAAVDADPSVTAGTFTATVEEFRPFQHGDTRAPLATPAAAVVRDFFAAFNRQEPAAFALLADHVHVASLDPDENLSLAGLPAVRAWIEGLFSGAPDLRVEISDLTQSGAHVSFRQRVSWTDRDGTRQVQTQLAIHEVRAGRIVRAWTSPAAP